jgi:glycosyltransferase involved in cell wall biosynthesis
LRILEVCPTYRPSLEGGAAYITNISERLAKQHDLTVFTCDPSGKLPQEEVLHGLRVKRFKCFSPGNAFYLSSGMALEIRKNKFDVVHAHNYHALPLFFAQFAPKSRLVVNPYYHGHGHTAFRDFLFKLYKPMGGSVLRKADRVIAISHFEKAALIKDFPGISSKIVIVPPGFNVPVTVSPENSSKNPKSILCVGRLEEYKGIQDIIQALPYLDSGFHAKVVGKGPYKDQLSALVKKLNLEHRVTFFQDLPRDELLRMYSEAGLFVLLSRFESYSIVVAEALACGTPCIVSDRQQELLRN